MYYITLTHQFQLSTERTGLPYTKKACSCRKVCTGMALQYRNNSAERRSVDGGILLCEQDYFPGGSRGTLDH